MYRAARLQISAQSRSSSMHRTIILMSCSCKQDAAQCSHAVTHSLQTSIQLSYCLSDITFLLFYFFVSVSANDVFANSPHLLCQGFRLGQCQRSYCDGGGNFAMKGAIAENGSSCKMYFVAGSESLLLMSY